MFSLLIMRILCVTTITELDKLLQTKQVFEQKYVCEITSTFFVKFKNVSLISFVGGKLGRYDWREIYICTPPPRIVDDE